MAAEDHRFHYHKPSLKAVAAIEKIRKGCRELQAVLDEALPAPSREKSLALTNLEQVSMWANKACVLHDPESEPIPPLGE